MKDDRCRERQMKEMVNEFIFAYRCYFFFKTSVGLLILTLDASDPHSGAGCTAARMQQRISMQTFLEVTRVHVGLEAEWKEYKTNGSGKEIEGVGRQTQR